jgi:mono/diheme cytochrome c family protein
VATVVVLVFGLWPEEVARESMRKPYVAGQYVYSNQIIGRDVPGMGVRSEIPLIEAHGLLKTQVFTPPALRTVTADNALQVGEFLALSTCSNCHSLGHTGMRPLAGYFGGNTDVQAIAGYLQAALSTGATIYMPRIPLQDDEARALATYIAHRVREGNAAAPTTTAAAAANTAARTAAAQPPAESLPR